MGEIADMMLDGTMCQGCGEFLHGGRNGPGFSGWCASCKPRTPKGRLQSSQSGDATTTELGAKSLKWLHAAARDSGMYQGEYWDAAPSTFERLRKRGLVERYEPHNSVRKARAVITDAGRALLS